MLGISSQDLAAFLNNSLSGFTVTYYRERDKQIEVVLRGAADERAQLIVPQGPRDPVAQRQGGADHADRRHPLRAGGRHRLAAQPAADDHRARRRAGDAQGPDVAKRIDPRARRRCAPTLPLGYRIEIGGAIEDSARGQKSIAAGVPLLVLAVLTLLMIQLQSFSRTLMVVLTAPLGLIGVVAGAARVRQAVRLRRDAGHDRAVRHHHAQLGDPRRPDRAGHRRRRTRRGTRSSARPCAASGRSC